MEKRIQGITVKIGGGTINFRLPLRALTEKSTQTALKDVEKLLKMDPDNTELLAQLGEGILTIIIGIVGIILCCCYILGNKSKIGNCETR